MPTDLRADGFWLGTITVSGKRLIVVAGQADRGVLYGAFALLRRIAVGDPIATLAERQEPAAPMRWVNEWNNLDGTIERGYAGPSIFFEDNNVRADLTRVGEYGRLLASVGINGVRRQQRQRQHARHHRRIRAAARAPGRSVPSLGRAPVASRSTSAVRRRSAASTRSIRSTRASRRSGRRPSIASTRRFRISAASC